MIGKSKEDAMKEYIETIIKLAEKYELDSTV